MKITPNKIDLQIEELRTGAAVSEGTIQKVGSSVNFWNEKFESCRLWAFNGAYYTRKAPQIGVDGSFGFFTNTEIYAIHFYNLEAGLSGDIEIDLIKHFADGSPSQSIFTVKPKLNYQAGDNAYLFINVRDNVILHDEVFSVKPVFAIKTFSAGDMITCNITSVQTGAKSAGVAVYFAPINA